MTIAKRIFLGYIIVLMLSVITCIGGVFGIFYLRGIYAGFISQDLPAILATAALRGDVEQQSSAFRGYMLYREPELITQWNEAAKDFEEQIAIMRAHMTDPREEVLLDAIQVANSEWRERQKERMDSGGPRSDIIDEIDAERENSRQVIMEQMEKFVDYRSKALDAKRTEVERKILEMCGGMIGLSSLAVLAGLLVAFLTTRSISRTLREAIGRLASSTAEISAMTRQVASGAAETAAAVSQTSSTVEEVKQTATVSAQKARTVSQTAQRSVEIAENGRGAVENSMQGMQSIREHMDIIGDSVIRLSEQGHAIGEIIATVNELADQSNLLAVNASIEAARAGDYGKGFGVVAQEVKSLADQSKLATAQVRSILGEVQRATGSAVMAAEQGNKAVETGVLQANAVGAAIQQLAANIAEAAQSATQIAASSQQQMAGMDQVVMAMEDISQASRQNAAGTVQSERAAEDLKELAQRLRSMIEKDRRITNGTVGGRAANGNE